MSLRNQILDGIDAAFDVLEDEVVLLYLSKTSNEDYNPSTSTVDNTSVPVICSGIITRVKPDMVDGDIVKLSDNVILLRCESEPENSDLLTGVDSKDEYIVIISERLYVNLYELVARKVGDGNN